MIHIFSQKSVSHSIMSCFIQWHNQDRNNVPLNSARSIQYEIIITKIEGVISLEEIIIRGDLCFPS